MKRQIGAEQRLPECADFNHVNLGNFRVFVMDVPGKRLIASGVGWSRIYAQARQAYWSSRCGPQDKHVILNQSLQPKRTDIRRIIGKFPPSWQSTKQAGRLPDK